MQTSKASAEKKLTDPVCQMLVREASAAGHLEFGGQDYYFCRTHCFQKFKADPNAFF